MGSQPREPGAGGAVRRISASASCAKWSSPVMSHESALPAMSVEGRWPAAYRARRMLRPQKGSVAPSNIVGPSAGLRKCCGRKRERSGGCEHLRELPARKHSGLGCAWDSCGGPRCDTAVLRAERMPRGTSQSDAATHRVRPLKQRIIGYALERIWNEKQQRSKADARYSATQEAEDRLAEIWRRR